MFSSCRAARVFTADEAPADRIITHPDIQPTSLRIRCNSHGLSHFGICERDSCWKAVGVVNISNDIDRIRMVLRAIVCRSLRIVWKLWTGSPLSVFLRRALSLACGERCAGATTDLRMARPAAGWAS